MTATTALTSVLASRAKTLRATRNAHARWMSTCDAMSATRGQDTPAADAALAAWRKGRPISKARKHRAYADADAILSVLNPDHVHTGTTADWDAALAAMKEAT